MNKADRLIKLVTPDGSREEWLSLAGFHAVRVDDTVAVYFYPRPQDPQPIPRRIVVEEYPVSFAEGRRNGKTQVLRTLPDVDDTGADLLFGGPMAEQLAEALDRLAGIMPTPEAPRAWRIIGQEPEKDEQDGQDGTSEPLTSYKVRRKIQTIN